MCVVNKTFYNKILNDRPRYISDFPVIPKSSGTAVQPTVNHMYLNTREVHENILLIAIDFQRNSQVVKMLPLHAIYISVICIREKCIENIS